MCSRPVLIGRGLVHSLFHAFASTVRFPRYGRGSYLNRVSAVIARGKRPVPFRTRKLSLSAPMVLQGGPCGRVGRRRTSSFRKGRPTWGGPFCFVHGPAVRGLVRPSGGGAESWRRGRGGRRSAVEGARQLLVSIPGIGTATADVVIAETGADMARFPTRGTWPPGPGSAPGRTSRPGRSASPELVLETGTSREPSAPVPCRSRG